MDEYPVAISIVRGQVELRDPQEDDREGIVSLADDDRLFEHMMIRFSRAEMDGWFTAWLAELVGTARTFWPLVIDVAGEATGFVMLSRPSDGVAEIQWYVAPRLWGRGYASEASSAALNVAFEALGVHRIFATADPENQPSCRILERAGFRREGHMIHYVLTHNGWRDRYMYALLDDEWRTSH